MQRNRTTTHRVYLVRCCLSHDTTTGRLLAERFVIEHVPRPARRRGFNSFQSMVEFLHAELHPAQPTAEESDEHGKPGHER